MTSLDFMRAVWALRPLPEQDREAALAAAGSWSNEQLIARTLAVEFPLPEVQGVCQ